MHLWRGDRRAHLDRFARNRLLALLASGWRGPLGAYGTAFWVDPAERLVVVLGAVTPGNIRKYYREQIAALVYGSMYPLPPPGAAPTLKTAQTVGHDINLPARPR